MALVVKACCDSGIYHLLLIALRALGEVMATFGVFLSAFKAYRPC